TEERTNPTTNEPETVRTFGWYLRKYIADTRAKGATPLVCSPVPRNIWREGKIARSSDGHAAWARAIAESEQTPFLDLHETIATRTAQLGDSAFTKLSADIRVHTNWEGAVLGAECVGDCIKNLTQHPLTKFLVARGGHPTEPAAQSGTPAPRSIAD